MSQVVHSTSFILWHDMIKQAEERCSIELNHDLEAYLISLLIRYTNKPELAKQVFAILFLRAMQLHENQRNLLLQQVGDHCLVLTGLFPKAAEKRNVKITYFVELGRTAYTAITGQTHDLFDSIGGQFVVLMDILQSLRPNDTLLPLDAYNQWYELGSKRSLSILKGYTKQGKDY